MLRPLLITNARAEDLLAKARQITPERPFVTEGDVDTVIAEVVYFLEAHPESQDPAQEVLARIDRNEDTNGKFAQAIAFVASQYQGGERDSSRLREAVLKDFGGTAAGLEERDVDSSTQAEVKQPAEKVQLLTLDDLAAHDPELAEQMKAAGQTHVTLVATDVKEASPEKQLTVDLYTYGNVLGDALAVLPKAWQMGRIRSLSWGDPLDVVNQWFEAAAKDFVQKKAVVIALDPALQPAPRVPELHPLVLLLKPGVSVNPAIVSAVIAQEYLAGGLILDLTAGTVREVRIRDQVYIAIPTSISA